MMDEDSIKMGSELGVAVLVPKQVKWDDIEGRESREGKAATV